MPLVLHGHKPKCSVLHRFGAPLAVVLYFNGG